jgi:hypothetical protein
MEQTGRWMIIPLASEPTGFAPVPPGPIPRTGVDRSSSIAVHIVPSQQTSTHATRYSSSAPAARSDDRDWCFADGTGVTAITDSLSGHYFPRWSVDESKIVFIHTDNRAAHPEIWVEGTGGSSLHPLTTLANGDNHSPSYTRQ